jgi:hypothetical protein
MSNTGTITAHTPPWDTQYDGDVTLTLNVTDEDYMILEDGKRLEYKFRERELLTEVQAYVDSTYDQHYATDKYQATDIIIDSGHGTGFCLGNVVKYAKRYGRKGSPEDARKDLMKVLHYALIQLYVHDEENK